LQGSKEQSKPTVLPSTYLRAIGVRCVKLNLFSLLAWTAPRWHVLVVEPLSSAGTSIMLALLHYIGLLVCCAGINFAFYWVVANSSVVLLSVLAGFNTVGSLLLSHHFFCSEYRANQCMSHHKAKCSAIVIGGVALYGIASALKSKKPEKLGKEKQS